MSLGTPIASFRDEWRRNPRLRLGGWLIVAILLVYAYMLLTDFRRSIEKDYSILADRLQRLETLSQEEGWTERVDTVRTLRVQMEGRLWRAESRGLAQANVQAWLDDLLQKLKIDTPRTQVDAALDVEGHDQVWQVGARVEAPFQPDYLLNLLRALETHPQMVSVEQLEILPGKKPRFILVFKAFFRAQAV